MAAKFAEPTEAEIVALLEKVTPENTKKQLNIELRFLKVNLRKLGIFQVIINLKQTLKHSYKTPMFVSRTERKYFWLAPKPIVL